jgi:hypothetical protein
MHPRKKFINALNAYHFHEGCNDSLSTSHNLFTFGLAICWLPAAAPPETTPESQNRIHCRRCIRNGLVSALEPVISTNLLPYHPLSGCPDADPDSILTRWVRTQQISSLAEFPDGFCCDPDYYRLRADEMDLARQRFPFASQQRNSTPSWPTTAWRTFRLLATIRNCLLPGTQEAGSDPVRARPEGYMFQVLVAEPREGELVSGDRARVRSRSSKENRPSPPARSVSRPARSSTHLPAPSPCKICAWG